MASKVLVKIPVAPFGHVNKGTKTNDVGVSEIVTRADIGCGPTTGPTNKTIDPLLRIAQLEQNIRFLQEQHQLMLTGLHQEIDNLRQRNRDLQFQLVFSKGSIVTPNSASPSSPEEDKTRVLSPKQVNVTPLQIELLERELGELKITLQEVNTKNVYLTAIVDEQKKKLERHEKLKEPTVYQPDPELLSKLDDVESLVRKLRRENDDLRREMTDSRSSSGHQQNRGRHRGNHHYRGHRFPPLHTQSYWHGGRGDKDGGEGSSGTSLPSLNMNNPQQPHYQSNGRRTNNNHHHQYHQGGGSAGGGGSENRKYRGGHSRGTKS